MNPIFNRTSLSMQFASTVITTDSWTALGRTQKSTEERCSVNWVEGNSKVEKTWLPNDTFQLNSGQKSNLTRTKCGLPFADGDRMRSNIRIKTLVTTESKQNAPWLLQLLFNPLLKMDTISHSLHDGMSFQISWNKQVNDYPVWTKTAGSPSSPPASLRLGNCVVDSTFTSGGDVTLHQLIILRFCHPST